MRFFKSFVRGGNGLGSDLIGEIISNGVRDNEITIGQALHQGRSTQAIGPVITEIGFAQCI